MLFNLKLKIKFNCYELKLIDYNSLIKKYTAYLVNFCQKLTYCKYKFLILLFKHNYILKLKYR